MPRPALDHAGAGDGSCSPPAPISRSRLLVSPVACASRACSILRATAAHLLPPLPESLQIGRSNSSASCPTVSPYFFDRQLEGTTFRSQPQPSPPSGRTHRPGRTPKSDSDSEDGTPASTCGALLGKPTFGRFQYEPTGPLTVIYAHRTPPDRTPSDSGVAHRC